MPLGLGYTVEGQFTGEESKGGLQVTCFDPKEADFPIVHELNSPTS